MNYYQIKYTSLLGQTIRALSCRDVVFTINFSSESKFRCFLQIPKDGREVLISFGQLGVIDVVGVYIKSEKDCDILLKNACAYGWTKREDKTLVKEYSITDLTAAQGVVDLISIL